MIDLNVSIAFKSKKWLAYSSNLNWLLI
jgi:hypothetical protein